MKTLLGTKLGMTQFFNEDGTVEPEDWTLLKSIKRESAKLWKSLATQVATATNTNPSQSLEPRDIPF